MLNSFRARIFFFIAGMVLMTALCISFFQQYQMESQLLKSEMKHASNLLKMATLHIETQYESYIFYKNALANEKKLDLETMMNLAFQEIENFRRQAEEGLISEEVAKQKAIDYLKRFRFANKTGYFWVNSATAPSVTMLMHPTMPELEGPIVHNDTSLFNTTNGNTRNIFLAAIEACTDEGQGFISYLCPKPVDSGLSEKQQKQAFVKVFKPWNWLIGTGFYMDDLEKQSHRRIDAIVKELRHAFAKITIAKNSYLFIFNGKYEILVHPLYASGSDHLQKRDTDDLIINALIPASIHPEQPIEYNWNKPFDTEKQLTYRKTAFVKYFAPFDWYIVASVYQDELIAPISLLRWKMLGIISILLVMVLIITSILAKNLSQPLYELALTAQKIESEGITAVQIPIKGSTEVRLLGNCLTSMLNSIQDVLQEKNELLNEIRSDEEKFRITLNSIADAVISTDTSGKILAMNPVAEHLTGWTFSEAKNKQLGEVYRVANSKARQQHLNPVKKILENEKSDHFFTDLILTAKGGQEYHISESGAPIRCECGQIRGVVLTFRNITERYLNQQRLKEAEWKFHALFEHGPLGVAYHQMIYDDNGQPFDYYFIDANSNYIQLTGVDPRGKTVREAFPGIENNPFDWISAFGEVVKTGKTKKFQQLLQSSGRWYDCVAFRYKPDHFVAAFFEITEQRKMEQQLVQAQKMDAIGQLAGGIAHDFNNVLGGILGAAELLAMEIGENENAGKYLNLIQNSSERAAELIGKLMAFGRQKNLASTAVNVHDAVREAIALLKYSIDKKISINVTLKAENSMVIGDLSQLQNVFLNLGINASHAMPDGGTLTIKSDLTTLDETIAKTYNLQPGTYIKFEIRDTGCGVKPEDLPRLFEPFFTTKALGKGTGLGLAAVFGIIKQHMGIITAYSEINVGTVFHLLLPLTDKKQTITRTTLPLAHGHGLILVIDDEPMIRTTAAAILKQLGYEVMVAENGLEGLKVFKEHKDKIDLVMLDMIMPIMNGRECYQKMQEIKPEVKVIMASGFSKEEDLQQLKTAGLTGFIHKPYGVAELSLLLEKTLKEKAQKPA